MSPTSAIIRGFLAQFHADGMRGIGDGDNLWREVNSLTLLQLVEYVEEKFAIRVKPIDFAPQNFSTIDSIVKFVETRKS